MFNLQLPKAYCGDAVVQAYLINRIPLKTLDFKTPLELLQEISSYLVPQKV